MYKWKQQMVEIANRNNARMDGSMAQVRGIIDAHDIVVAVWQDCTEPHGVGCMLVKGEDVLRRIIATQGPTIVKQTAISCNNIEQAMALVQVYGDRERNHRDREGARAL